MSSNIIVSDEDLIEELRRYGEKNLPIIQSTTSLSSKKKTNQLNDQNREIYLKKLNHYKAREKVESNPSKQFLKQFSNNLNKLETPSNLRTSIKQELNDDDDIIELNETSEYVQVSNAFTSPLSISSNEPSQNIKNIKSPRLINDSKSKIINNRYSDRADSPLQNNINYVSLKDRLELDKTLSKYRSEINDIINKSTANRKTDSSVLNKYLKTDANDIVCTGTYSSKSTNTFSKSSQKNDLNLETNFVNNFEDITKNNNNANGFNLINGFLKYRNRNLEQSNDKSSSTYLSPKINDQRLKTNTNYFSNYILSFFRIISNFGLQLSRLLPYLVIIIFTIILLQYVRMKFFTNDNKIESNIPLNTQNNNKVNHFYCDDIKSIDCSQTKLMVKELIDYLRYKSGQIDCSLTINSESQSTLPNTKHPDFIEKCIHLTKITKYLDEDKNLITHQQFKQEAINSMINAIIKNPHWKLRLLNSSYDDTNQLLNVTYIMSVVSSKSLICRSTELIHFLYIRLLMVTFIVIFLIVLYFIYKTIIRNRSENDKAFFNLVNQVTNMVEKHYDLSLLDPDNIKPYIAISHIHDTLFDPSIRTSNKKLWENVVKFIQDHESRIHLMTEFIDGEETHVWKWVVPKHINNIANVSNSNKPTSDGIGLANSTMIHNTINSNETLANHNENLNSIGATGVKENINVLSHNLNTFSNNGWQGDAFNRCEKLTHSPTPCLKIRNMFDPLDMTNDPFLATKIHNDILDKFSCNSIFNKDSANNFILHISCDKKSKEGCVYIKCKSNEAAGKIYQTLNGTWYNGKLLNVKFLRSDRYLERFPDSINFNKPIQHIKL
jgi:hypothetical protein